MLSQALIFIALFLIPGLSIRASTLEILESHVIQAKEISGMCWRTNPKTKKRELVLVGDGSHYLHIIDWEKRAQGIKLTTIDVSTFDKNVANEKSEWESVYSDETGRIFVLRENPSRLLVFAPELNKIEADIELHVPPSAEKELAWKTNENAKGEGLLLLGNGHLLVIKEKEPLRILEFSPLKSSPHGYLKKFSIEKTGIFPFPKDINSKLELAQNWSIKKEFVNDFKDSSGLNVNSEGTLFILSDEGNRIGEIGDTLIVGQEISIKRQWELPTSIKQPEGMVFDNNNRPIISIDNKKTKKANLFVLSPIR